MSTPDQALAPIKARLNAATDGPFIVSRFDHGGGRMVVEADGGRRKLVTDTFEIGDREFYAEASTDITRLIAAIEGTFALHKPAKIYDECECPEGTHPDDYDYIDCDSYAGCENSLIAIGCEECCVHGDYLSEACGESHTHTLDPETRCPTVAALSEALGDEG